MALPTTPIGPWPLGIVNTVSDHAIPPEGLADARDCDIGDEGHAVSRPTFSLLSDVDAFKYFFEHNGIAYAVHQGSAGVIGEASFTAIQSVSGRVGWGLLGDSPIFTDYAGVYQINGLTASQFVSRTPTEEEERYGMVDMPGGIAVTCWNGRLLVLRGRSILWSEPLDYGNHASARNFLRLESPPTWMAALPFGVYVGLRDKVVFLAGTDPKKWEIREVSGPSCSYSGIVIEDPRHLDEDFSAVGPIAVWFSDVGFVVGQGDGGVAYPQAGNLRGLPLQPRNLAVIEERIYAFISEE